MIRIKIFKKDKVSKSGTGWYRSLVIIISLLFIFVVVSSTLVSAKNVSTARGKFYSLRHQCIQTLKDPKTLSSRTRVASLSRECLSFQRRYPTTSYATRALYLSGMLWEGLYSHTKHITDWNQALRSYSKVIALYPDSTLVDDVLFRRGVLYLKIGLNRLALTEFKKLVTRYPKSDLYQVTRAHINRLTKKGKQHRNAPQGSLRACNSRVTFNGFRYWSNRKYARVVMDFSSRVPFHFKSVKDKKGTKIIFTLDEPFVLHCSQWKIHGKSGDFFKYARLKKRNYSSLITIQFGPNAQSRVFTLVSPFRIVIDALRESQNKRATPGVPPYRSPKDFIICLDPGHGGKDPGATGPHGIKEKNVVLRIARLLREKLMKRYGYKVIMTRNRDVYIPLEQRVAFANSRGADLFVSIHINASRNRRLQGISTFCLSNTSDRKSLRLAARENGIPLSKMSNVDKILNDMLFSEKYNESYKVAHIIHQSLIRDVRQYNPRVNNLGVRFAPFYVLAGAKMPSILLELDFISNPYVEKKLVQYTYINRLADGIAKGIAQTTRSMHVAKNYFN